MADLENPFEEELNKEGTEENNFLGRYSKFFR